MIIVSDRKLLIPSGEKHIGFTGDNMVEQRVFVISNNKIFDLDYRIDLGNTGETAILQKRISSDGKLLFLSWNITAAVLKNTPAVEFQLRGFEADGERIWHSEKNSFYTDESIDASNELTEEELDEFHVIEKQVANYLNEVQALRDEAQVFRNEAQDMAQQSLADYSEFKESVYTKSETDAAIKASNEALVNRVEQLLNEHAQYFEEEFYHKSETNEKINQANIEVRAQTNTQIQTLTLMMQNKLNEKASADNVYTKSVIDTKIGNIDTALDELHSYAQALIGGEA